MSRPDRQAMLDRDRWDLSIRRQCVLLSLARSGVYRPQRPANDDDLVLMRRIDQLFLAWPFLGSRRMTAMLRAEGLEVNRKRVRRLMRLMGIAALGPKPRTTKPQHGHKIFPYLLRDLVIERPNQVWAADITYIPIGRGFLYLVAVIDWLSRAVLAWRLSNTMDAAFVSTHWKRRSPAGAGPRSSTPTRAASSPVPPSPAHWWRPGSGFRWTAAAAGSTTSSSNGCGAR
jgi:putative transposase